MSKRIEGITIKIGADTTQFNNAIKGVEGELKSTQSQLRDVNRLLKLDPGNTDLLQQKQRLLGEAITETKKKLESLREAQKQAGEALAKGEISQQQYGALQREIIQTENDLKKLEQQAKETNKALSDPSIFDNFSKAGQKIQEIGGKVSDVGKGMTKNVTAPIVAVGAASMKAFSEVDKGFDTIVAKTGATGQALEEMRTSMENIASRIPTDFETAGAAIGEVNTRFGSTGSELENLSEKFVKFAKLNNTDVSNSVDSVQKALSAFGLGAQDAEAFLDRLNKTGQETGVSVDSVTAGLISNATAFKELGLSIDQSTIFMGKLEKSGANSETVLNGMRKALKNATAEGIPLDQALSDLQNTILNGTDSIDGLTAAYDIFGKSGDQIYGAVKDGTINFADLAGSVSDATGSIDSAYETTMDGTDKLRVTFNHLKVAGAELGGAIGETLAPILEKLAKAIKKVTSWFQNLSPETKGLIVKIGLLVAAIGPALFIIGKVISVIGTVMALIGAIGPAIAGVGGVVAGVAAGPLIAIVAAIAGVIAAGVLLYQHWDEVKAKAAALWEGISGIFTTLKETWDLLWEGLKTTFSNFWNGLMENPIIQLFLQLITDELNLFSDTLSTIWDNIKKIAGTAWELIKTVILGPVQLIKDLVTGDFDALKEDAKKIWDNIKELAGKLWGEIKDAIIDVVKGIFDGVKKIFQDLKKNLEEIWTNIKNSAKQKWDNMKTEISNAVQRTKEAVSQKWQEIKDTVSEKAKKAKDSAVETFGQVGEGIRGAMSNVKRKVEDAMGAAIDWLKGLGDDAWDWGEDMMINFANGIASGVTWVWDQVDALVGWIDDMLGFSEPEIGPLSDFHKNGPDMMKLLAKGIRDNAYLVKDAIGDVAGALSGTMSGAANNSYTYGATNITVYGAAGQDVTELARVIEDRINTRINRQGAVFR